MNEQERKWATEVITFLDELIRQEENAWMQRGRKYCPYCKTGERDDDDGSWMHDESCPFDSALHLYMTSPNLREVGV